MEKFGIEKLKAITALIIVFIREVEQVLADSKVSFWEVLGLAPELKSIPQIFDNLASVKEELRDLSTAEVLEFQSFLVEKLDFTSEMTVYHLQGLLSQAVKAYTSFVEFRTHLAAVMKPVTTSRSIAPAPPAKSKSKPKPKPKPEEEEEEEIDEDEDLDII